MKLFITRCVLCMGLLLMLSPASIAQTQEEEIKKLNLSRYELNSLHYHENWEKLIPTHGKIQFAGNMGFMSLGGGWDYGKKNQWETDILFGLIPKNESEKARITMTLKQNYIPWSVFLGGSWSFEPLTCGVYFNTVFGQDFWVQEPDRYPKGYYGFSTKIRSHIFAGQRFTYDIAPKYRYRARKLTFFYEISTCDLLFISAFTNRYLTPSDYLSLSLGVKIQIF